MSSLVRKLYDFHFKNRAGQAIVYSFAFILSISYMTINSLTYPQSQQSTIIVGLILATFVILFMPLTIIYEISSPPETISFSIGKTRIYQTK
jgi:hypothetical protein